MAFVVCEPCVKCKYTDCVAVCPCDCFHEGENFLVIDPDICIDCDACRPVCPINSIYRDSEVPERWTEYVELNARFSKEWPQITATKDSLPDADDWAKVADKRAHLSQKPAS
ncbi:MAG TPA: ferredoxin FdxA [Gemmataceae bacterium]|nr:ferredoxin FdxA [Gemmataceae bacterium]